MEFSEPGDRIVFSTFPEDVERLKGDAAYRAYPAGHGSLDSPTAILRKLPHFYGDFSGSEANINPDAICFLHERVTKSSERFVVEALIGRTSQHFAAYSLASSSPSELRPHFSEVIGTGEWTILETGNPSRPSRLAYFRVWAGQADPVDQSHFTIKIQNEGDAPVTKEFYVYDGGSVSYWRQGTQPPQTSGIFDIRATTRP